MDEASTAARTPAASRRPRIVRDAVNTPIALDDDGPAQPDIAAKG